MSVGINNPSTTSGSKIKHWGMFSSGEGVYCQYWFWVSNAIFIINIFLIISINVNYLRLVIFRFGTKFPRLHVFWYLNFPICTTVVPCPSCHNPVINHQSHLGSFCQFSSSAPEYILWPAVVGFEPDDNNPKQK